LSQYFNNLDLEIFMLSVILNSARQLAIALAAQGQTGYWKEATGPALAASWALFVAALLTLIFLAWQAWETRRAAQATQKSAVIVEGQSAILKKSVAVAEEAADAAGDSAAIAKVNTEALINAERAWILAELGWHDEPADRIREDELGCTAVYVRLTCKNEGRSPAWIDHVYGRVDIASLRSDVKEYSKQECGNFGLMEPVGAGGEKCRGLGLHCDGTRKGEEFLSVSVIIEYHDIFGKQRETTIGYSVVLPSNLYRQNGSPNRNRNT
jgi:hypothetical protein